EGRQIELLQTYRKSVLSAFSDVEQALIAVQQEALRETYQREVVRTSQKAFDISRQRLEQGTLDMVTLTQTQETLFTAQAARRPSTRKPWLPARTSSPRSGCCACRRPSSSIRRWAAAGRRRNASRRPRPRTLRRQRPSKSPRNRKKRTFGPDYPRRRGSGPI